MSRYTEEGSDAPQLSYNQAAGLISSLAGSSHQRYASHQQFTSSLDLLQQVPIGAGTGPQHIAQVPQQPGPQSGQNSTGGLTGYGTLSFGADKDAKAQGERQLCTFFLRTGTCAYGDRCKFKHPLDRPPPTLNTRGYPVRAEEPDCAHYLKKGWCAFGPTCKFNHPELAPSILSSYNLSQAPTAYVSVPTTTFPSATVAYSLPSALPTVYYLPPGVSPNQLAGSTVSLLPSNMGTVAATQPNTLFQQQNALATAAAAPVGYRQAPVTTTAYGGAMTGGMGATMGGGIVGGGAGMGMGMGMGGIGNVSALQEAFQGLALRTGGMGGRGK